MFARTALLLLYTSLLVTGTPDPPSKPRDLTPRETSQNFLSAFFRLANQFQVSGCIPGALPLITTLPKIPPALFGTPAINQALSQTTLPLSDVCRFSITGDVGDTYTAFLPTWYSWYRAQSDAIARIVTACPSAQALISTVEAYESCSQVAAAAAAETGTGAPLSIQTDTVVGGDGTSSLEASSALSIQTDTVIGGDSSATATATVTATQSTTATTTGGAEAPSSTVPTDAAPREKGFMLAAAVAAGFVGLVAAL
ncbi:hypothetical protein F4810DRAFT_608048 [Camillea tinctor]|nr:hypothetical protein F4810DRAFT_608048 [Camillea tinctor]